MKHIIIAITIAGVLIGVFGSLLGVSPATAACIGLLLLLVVNSTLIYLANKRKR
jgi:xanthosine utilization system XapX-like protein